MWSTPGCGVHGGVKVGASSQRLGRAPEGAQGLLSCPMSPLWCPRTCLGTGVGQGLLFGPPHPWVMAPLRQPCAGRFLSGPSAPAGRRGRRRWRNLSTLTQRESQGLRSRRTVVRTQRHGHGAGITVAGTSSRCHHGGTWGRSHHDGAPGRCHHT